MPRTDADSSILNGRIDRIRRFNRFYTRLIGVLDEKHLNSRYSMAQARTLYELAHRSSPTPGELTRDLGLDAGYMSRILRGFEEKKLIERTEAPNDRRQYHLRLTSAGRKVFGELNGRARSAIASVLEPLADESQRRMLEAMGVIEKVLGQAAERDAILIRAHQPGDMGHIVSRQAILYHEEYGWNQEYEALTSRIVADFIDRFDPDREKCWVAERSDMIVGSVFLIRHPEKERVAKLRLLYVEPSARGSGLGRRLVKECSTFAKRVGYECITLWTNSVLTAARRIYEGEGYRLISEEPHHSFGTDLIGQTWELDLKRRT
jgi:DNA-binding MarR family transcriptional regulator/GNAT superfamily N-acetyltransferase